MCAPEEGRLPILVQQIAESLEDGLAAYDPQFRFIWLNRAAEVLLGCPGSDLVGRSQWEAFPATLGTPLEAALRRAMESRETIKLDQCFGPGSRWQEIRAGPTAGGGLLVQFHDITERRKADEDLQSKSLFPEQNPYPVLRVGRDGTLQFANPASGRLLAMWNCAVGRSVPAEVRKEVQSALSEGVVKELNVVHDSRRISFILAPSDGLDCVNLYGRDVTEQARAEEALQAEHQLLETVVDHLPAPVCLIRGSDLRLQMANSAYCAIAPGVEMVGRTLDELWPETGQDFSAICRRVLETGSPHRAVDELNMIRRRPGGPLEPAYFSWSLHRVLLPGGDGWGLLNSAWETTGRRQAEEELRQSRENLCRAQQVGQMGWWHLDSRQNVLTWSDETYRIFGVPMGTPLTYETFLRGVSPDDRLYVDAMWRAAAQGAPYDIEHRIVADGQVKWVREKAFLEFDEAGNLLGGFGIAQDITERKRAEERFEEMYREARQEIARRERVEKELRRSNADLEQFAFAVSHDLRSPLNAITSFAKQLDEEFHAKLGPDAAVYLDYLTGASARLRRLISDLLVYARVADQEQAKPGTGDCEEALRIAELNLSEKVRDSGAVITHDPLPVVTAGPGLLTQVFQNLVENAIKFRGAAEPRVHISAERQEFAWRFCVSDNGIGIEPEQTEQVFRIFKRLHGDTYEGTGIGLAICKKIVERHGGRIWVASEPGQGTRVFFTLPATTTGSGELPAEA